MKKRTKKEIREAASTAIHGLIARLELKITGSTKRVAKEVAKTLANEIVEEQKKQIKKLKKQARLAEKAIVKKTRKQYPPEI